MTTQVNLQAKEASLEAQIAALQGSSFKPSPQQTQDLVKLNLAIEKLQQDLKDLQATPSLAKDPAFQNSISDDIDNIEYIQHNAASDFSEPASSYFYQNLTSNDLNELLGVRLNGLPPLGQCYNNNTDLVEYLNYFTNSQTLSNQILPALADLNTNLNPYMPTSK